VALIGKYGILLLGLVACSSEKPVDNPSENSGWEAGSLHHAEMFSVWTRGKERLVYLFEGRGEKRDTLEVIHLVPKGTTGLPVPNTTMIEVPVERVVTASTTHVPFFNALNEMDRLVGCAFLVHVMDSAVLPRTKDGRLLEISDGQRIDKEKLLMADPGLLLSYPFGKGMEGISLDGSFPMIGITEYLEPHPLGRAEWIRLFGMLVGREKESIEIHDQLRVRYDSIRMRNMLYSFLPGVFFGSYWQGQWHASGGDSYMANLIRDAGARYLLDDKHTTESVTIDLEELVVRSENAHVFGKILHQERAVEYADVVGFDERLLELVEEKEMILFYGNTATSDLFGKALLEPDVMLEEISRLIRTGEEVENPVYFRRFKRE
jgi:iron complex transport system substrate-binding protein